MSKTSDRTVGIRYLMLLIPLFAAVICASFALSYPKRIDSALASLERKTPLANPEIRISGIITTDALAADLAKIGKATPAVIYDTETAVGTPIRLNAMHADDLDKAIRLTEGRMPQSAYECVVVALYPTASPAIGAAILPCGEDGTVLLSADGKTPCMLTVVGIGENTLSTLAPITESSVGLLIYTTDASVWNTANAESCVLLTDCTVPDPFTAVQTISREHSAVQTAYLKEQTAQRRTALLAAAETADNAVTEQEIIVQNLDNRLDTASLRASELEKEMMDAVAVLQAEQQQFVSDMEYNEYYALRQVDLIPRRDRAEEGYAKQEAVIAALNEELHAAYAERDAIAAEREAAVDALTALHTAAEEALAILNTAEKQTPATVSWEITCAGQEAGTALLIAHASSYEKIAWMLSSALAAVFFIGSIIVYSVSRRPGFTAIPFAGIALVCAIPAILFGSCVLTNAVFRHFFPALTELFSQTVLAPSVLLLLPITALLAMLSVILGHRIHKTAAPKTK